MGRCLKPDTTYRYVPLYNQMGHLVLWIPVFKFTEMVSVESNLQKYATKEAFTLTRPRLRPIKMICMGLSGGVDTAPEH